jgi:predicted phosphodiesterase
MNGETGRTWREVRLGVLDGTVMVFGGPYSNLQATRAIRDRAEDLDIAPSNIICTGDLVAYCGEAAATAEFIRNWGIHVVMGNCEEQLAAMSEDCGCGFDEGSACDVLAARWYAHARSTLRPDQYEWMGTLPHRLRFGLAGLHCVAIHGGADQINRFIFPSTPVGDKRHAAEALRADLVIAGHSGLPFSQALGQGHYWLNAGALGLPANDGTPDTWYSLLTPAGDGLDITHHRLAYDHEEAARRLAEARPGDPYAEALKTGLWPSLDVLPQAERADTGKRLSPPPLAIAPASGI